MAADGFADARCPVCNKKVAELTRGSRMTTHCPRCKLRFAVTFYTDGRVVSERLVTVKAYQRRYTF